MAKARPIPGLSPAESYAAAAAKIVAVRARELEEHSAGVLDVSDPERVHDMRVASRRLRAALEIFEPCFPPKRYRKRLRDVKRLADALGERRDRDVTIVALERFRDELPVPDRPGLESLIAEVRAEQAQANADLAPHVAEERVAALGEELNELVIEARGIGASP